MTPLGHTGHLAIRLAAASLVAAALLLAWLARAESADAAVRAVRQQRALALGVVVLATFATPWAFAVIAAESPGGRAVAWAYTAALPLPFVLFALAMWLGRAGEAPAIHAGQATALAFAYGVLACAATDACRLASPALGPVAPMCAGALLCLSPFIAGPWVEHAPDQPRREVRIAWVVAVNPLLAATATLPDYDPLRAEHVYERTPIGAYFVYRLSDPWRVTAAYLALATALGAAAAVSRRGGAGRTWAVSARDA